ncbi:RNA-binding S4 domain-containing protein [Streptomyces sp. NPDC004589]|uniref:RNA-binding S4 domain-containing protein n=1 Tax=Streptomyces sp. NPDC004589 TaxID=3154553 RepID=UPI0033BEE894
MAAVRADDDRTGRTVVDRESGMGPDREAGDRQDTGTGGTSRTSDASGPADPEGTCAGAADGQTVDAKTAAAVAVAKAAGPSNGESVRIDSWIWSVRLVKTRSIGADACKGGHVRVNGERVKPAYAVRVGDEVRLRHEGRERIVVVKQLIRKRVGAPVAVQCYIDNSPPPPPREAVAPAGIRDRGTGRPTKRDRREMERLRGLGAAPGGFAEALRAQGQGRSQNRSAGRRPSEGRGRADDQGGAEAL